MFVVTLKKAGLKKVGVGVLCCALVVFSAMLGRYISGRSVMAAAAAILLVAGVLDGWMYSAFV